LAEKLNPYAEWLKKRNQKTLYGQAIPYRRADANQPGNFWDYAQERIKDGWRLTPAMDPGRVRRGDAPSWTQVRLPTQDDYWKAGRDGAYGIGSKGRSHQQMLDELELAQHPGAVRMLDSGVPYYGGKNDVEERRLRIESLMEYGTRYIEDLTLDTDTQMQFDTSGHLAERYQVGIDAYRKKAQTLADGQDQLASHKRYEWIFQNVGQYYHTFRQKSKDLFEAGLANGYANLTQDPEYLKAWEEADKQVQGDFFTKHVYNPVTQTYGAMMHADLAENLFYQWLPWNWGKEDSVHSLGDKRKVLNWLKDHPGATEAVARKTLVNDYWDTFAEEWLNPADLMVDKAFEIIFPPLAALTAAKAAAKFFPRIARRGAKVTPALAKVLGKIGDNARLGGMTDEMFEIARHADMTAAYMDDAAQTVEDLAKWQGEFGIFTSTQETKAFLTAQDTQDGIRWIKNSLGNDTNPIRFYERLQLIGELGSGDAKRVDEAMRVLSRVPNFDFWFTQSGQTAAYMMNKVFDGAKAEDLKKLVRKLDKIDSPGKKAAELIAWADNLATKQSNELFPTLEEMVKAGRKLPPHLKAAERFHRNAQKLYGPVTQWFSNWYLGRTPGYALRNGVQNFGQTIWDMGIGSRNGWKHIDDAFDWAGFDRAVDAGKKFGSQAGDILFVGMERELAGIGGVIGEAAPKRTGIGRFFDFKWWSNEAEKLGGRTIFGHEYPKEMQRILKGNLKRRFMTDFGLDKQTASFFEEAIVGNKGNIAAAKKQIENSVTDGFWRNATLSNLTPEMQKKAQAFNLNHRVFDWVNEADDFDQFAKNIDDWTDDVIESAEKQLRREGATSFPAVEDPTVGVSANAVAFDGMPQEVHDILGSTVAANMRVNELTTDAIITMREEAVAGLMKVQGVDETTARTMFAKWTSEVKLTVEGDKAAAVGKLTGDDLINGRKYSPREIHNKKLWKQKVEIGNRYGDRKEDIARLWDDKNTGEIADYWNKHFADVYGEYVDQDLWELQRANYRLMTDEQAFFWNDWTEQHYNMSRQVADHVLQKVSAEGIPIAPAEHLFRKAGDALDNAHKYQKWLPAGQMNHAIDQALKIPVEHRRLNRLAVEYARMFGVESYFEKEGAQFLNHTKLTSIINKQLGTKFDNLNSMSGVKPSQIKEAMKAHSLGLYMNIVDNPDHAIELLLKAADAGPLGNKVMLERLTQAEMRELKRFSDLIYTADADIALTFNEAFRKRNALDAPQMGQTHEAYNELAKMIKEADEAVAKAGEDMLSIISDKKVVGESIEETTEFVAKAQARTEVDADDFIHLWGGEDAPTQARVVYESQEEMREFVQELKTAFQGQWDDVVRLSDDDKIRIAKQFSEVEDVSKGMMSEARLAAMRTVREKRDFILHNYGNRRNFDTLLAYIYPYHFWHSRNAANWAKRVAKRPGIARGYMRYKDRMERINSDQPEWFRNNVRLTGFLGFDEDNPLLINLEALVSPAYQVLKVPFHDPDKRDTAFARFLDGAGRVASTHTLYSLLYGFGRYVQGDRDQGAAWMSRLIPQTKVTTAASSVIAKQFGLDQWERGIELDPVIGLQGAIEGGDIKDYFTAYDPYEQKRVAMGYQQLVRDGKYTEEEIIDAIMSEDKDHPITVEAHGIAQSKKNTGDILSFIGGPSFQVRSQDERKILAMDQEFRNLFDYSDYVDKDEKAQLYALMREKYPTYFNSLMLTRKDRDQREEAFVYNVLARIPPGQTSQIYEAVGLNYDNVQAFYDSKGETLKTMPEADRLKFMAGMIELSTVAAFPSDALRNEWTEVKNRNKAMRTQLEEFYGEDTFAYRDQFFSLMKESPEQAYQFLDAHPDVQNLMSDTEQWKMSDPLLTKYYATYDNARSMLSSEMYDRLNAMFPGIQDEQTRYYDAKNAGGNVKPSDRLKDYWAEKRAMQTIYDSQLVAYGHHLPESGTVEFPKRFDPFEPPEDLSEGAQELAGMDLDRAGVPIHYQWNWEQWAEIMDPTLARLVQDWAFRGAELGEDAERGLEYVLEPWGIDLGEAEFLIQKASREAGAEFYSEDNPPWWVEQ
jgi:hypothetical protein